MFVQSMIYIYMAICGALIIFEVYWIRHLHRNTKRQKQHSKKLLKQMLSCCQKLSSNPEYSLSRKDLSMLKNSLSKPLYTISFMQIYSELKDIFPQEIALIMEHLTLYVMHLFDHLKPNTDSTTKAYMVKLLAEVSTVRGENCPRKLISHLYELLYDDSVFCRANTMTALFKLGTHRDIAYAIELLSLNHLFYHPKMLTEGLCTFNGNHSLLADSLYANWDKYSESYQIAILEYFSRYKMTIGDSLLELFDKKCSVDLTCALIRYYKQQPHLKAKMILMQILQKQAAYPWEVVAVAAKSLSSYSDPAVKRLLKNTLTNSNWFIRRNAAESLVHMGMTMNEVAEVVQGPDRYAREILQYNLTIAQDKKARKEYTHESCN